MACPWSCRGSRDRSCGRAAPAARGATPRKASTFPSANNSIGVSVGSGVTQSMSLRGSSPTWAAMIETYRCVPEPRTSMPTFLPFRSLMVRMGSCANSSKQPACTPASAVIGTPASRRKDGQCREKQDEVDLAASDHLRISGPDCARNIADVGEPLRTQQILGDVPGRDADRWDHGATGSWWSPAAPRRRAIRGCQARLRRRLGDRAVRKSRREG